MKLHKRYKRGIGLLLCMIMSMSVIAAGCGSKDSGPIQGSKMPVHVTADTQTTETATEGQTEDETEAAVQGLYEVMAVNTQNSVMSFWNIASERQEQYAYTDGTRYLDKYGSLSSLSKMMPGIVVSIQLLQKTGSLETVQISDGAWEYEDIRRFSIDVEKKMIKIADTKYYYEEDLHVFSEDKIITPGEIGENDILRIQGIGKKILTVSVTTGHGTLQLENTELFEGGWLSLGTKTYLQITENMQLELAEGSYQLTVANDGWGGSQEITIKRGEETRIDLDELKGDGPQYCTVTFEVGVADATLAIDGELVDYSKPVEVRYGIHQLTISATGYDDWSKKLFVNSSEATIQVAMTAESEVNTETETNTSESSSQTGTGTASEKTSEKSTTTTSSGRTDTETSSETAATQTYLDTLSDIISTLTGSSK